MEKVLIEFFDAPNSRFGGKARQRLLELVAEMQQHGIGVVFEEKNALCSKNRAQLREYVTQLGLHAAVVAVPLIAVNGRAVFLGFHADMNSTIKMKAGFERLLQ